MQLVVSQNDRLLLEVGWKSPLKATQEQILCFVSPLYSTPLLDEEM